MKAARPWPVRRFLFIAFIAGYAAACPLVILYALGYIVQPSQDDLRRTGGIFVASVPTGASLALDGKPYPRGTPLAVLQLRPGSYRVRMDLKGYRPWEERVWVTPGRVTTLDNLLLVPEHRVYVEEAPDWFLDMIPGLGYPYLILQKGTRARDLVVYDIPNRRFIQVVDSKSPFRNATVAACLTAPGSPYFLLETVSPGSAVISGVRIQRPRPLLQDLTNMLPAAFEDPRWTGDNPRVIFTYNGSSVDRTDLRSGTVTPGYVKQVSGYGLHGDWLYAISWTRRLLRFDLARQNRQDLSRFDGEVADFPVDRFVSVRPMGTDLILLWGQGGRFKAAGPSSSASVDAVEGYQLDSRTGHVLLWQDHDLAILHKEVGEDAPTLQWLSRHAGDVRQAFLVTASSNVLYRDGNSVFLASRLQDNEWRTSFVAAARLGTSVYYSEPDAKLYYIDPETGKLFSTQIVPRQHVLETIVQKLRQDSGH